MAFCGAFLCLAPGLEAIAEVSGRRLGTRYKSTLSYALGSCFHARLVRILLDYLAPKDLSASKLVALDSMAITLPKTRRHHCARINNKTVGGGVLWAFVLDAHRAISPVRLLRVLDKGSWCDAKEMKTIALEPLGPIYLMDRGFYAIDLMATWLAQGVRFIVRARDNAFTYEPVRELRAPRKIAGGIGKKRRVVQVVFDGIARIGVPNRRGERPLARLIVGHLLKPDGTLKERLILISSELDTTASRILAAYRRRWEIERFHKLLKRTIGLAHLYSFRQKGIEFLVCIAVLTTLLLWLQARCASRTKSPTATITLLLTIVRTARRPLRLQRLWRPNTVGKSSWRHRG